MLCYCSICRKLCGGGFGVNIRGLKKNMKVTGARSIKRYRAVMGKGKRSGAVRAFCGACGSHLWLEEPKHYPNEFWPNAGVIDTALPLPKEFALIFVGDRPQWAPMPKPSSKHQGYPSFTILQWHEKRGLLG